jgi:Uma2 family endonuclease
MIGVEFAAAPVRVEDWDALEVPTGYRAEIIRGEFVVTPSAPVRHNWAQYRLIALFESFIPPGFGSVPGQEWRFDWHGVVAMAPVPDIVVIRWDGEATGLVEPPLLAVEISSPSDRQRLANGMTRREGKLADYAERGLADYLELDVLTEEPTAVRYELHHGELVEVDRAAGSTLLHADRPFVYEFRPIDLVTPR